MRVVDLVCRHVRRSLAVVLSFLLIAGGAPAVLAQGETAAIAGVVLDPSGQPASGFKVVVRDVASGQEFTSGPTDAQGNYSTQVPVGGKYKLTGVIASDGVTKLPVQDVPAVNVLTAGTTRLNVRFTQAPAPAAPATAAPKDEKEKKKGAVPWYKKPGPIIGIVLGSLLVVGLAASGGGGGSSRSPSPSLPSQ